tara:strand:+ start:968 stop:1207 length:240 start_codon:yes stop_codon:yes gene_type:complete
MLTVPKIKDLVNKPITQYNEIISSKNVDISPLDKKENGEKQNMENELQNFIKDLKKSKLSTTTILSANEISNNNDFSTY